MTIIGRNELLAIALVVLATIMLIIIFKLYISSIINDIKKGNADLEIIDEALYENQSHIIKRKKIIKTIKSIGFYGLMIVMAPIIVLAFINKIQGNLMIMGDLEPVVVASGSMSQRNKANDYLDEHNLNNQFNTYDVIIIEAVQSEDDLSTYDVVAYQNDKGEIILHRIIGDFEDEFGVTRYITRGDSNNETDDYNPVFEDIRGKYINIRIPIVGMLILFFQSFIGIITVILLILCLTFMNKQQDKLIDEKNKRLDLFSCMDLKYTREEKVKFIEYVYYKEYVYEFNEKGFIGKKLNVKGPYKELPSNKLVRVTEKEGSDALIEEFIIEEK